MVFWEIIDDYWLHIMWFILFLILLQAEELQNQMEQDYDIGWVYTFSVVNGQIY